MQAQFHVETVSVEGNVHYTKEEIEQMVIKDRLSANSIYLSFKYRDKEILNIPFIEKMSVRVDSPNSITIRVYEKSVAGYVEYMGRYMYFDREGIVVESSETKTSGVPQVTGIDFDQWCSMSRFRWKIRQFLRRCCRSPRCFPNMRS